MHTDYLFKVIIISPLAHTGERREMDGRRQGGVRGGRKGRWIDIGILA